MSELDVVERTRQPGTVTSVGLQLSALGIRPGMVLLVHASLSALGWICGEAVAVIQALQAAVGTQGTLIMPTFTGGLTDPRNWQNPPVPEEWKETIRSEMPAYDPLRTPTREMGRIAETFRTWPHVTRSQHPHCSFSAWGKHARTVTAAHSLDNGLGEESPLARIYDLDGWVLLLGVGFVNNTSFHLAEYRADYPGRQFESNAAPVLVNGRRQRVTLRDVELDVDDFPQLGESLMTQTQLVRSGKVGEGSALLMPQRAVVDYAVTWFAAHRTPGTDT